MKTVDTVALEIIEAWEGKTFRDECQAKAALQIAIIDAIKQQDRKTRHACAESLISLCRFGDDKDYIKTDEATKACINARAL